MAIVIKLTDEQIRKLQPIDTQVIKAACAGNHGMAVAQLWISEGHMTCAFLEEDMATKLRIVSGGSDGLVSSHGDCVRAARERNQ